MSARPFLRLLSLFLFVALAFGASRLDAQSPFVIRTVSPQAGTTWQGDTQQGYLNYTVQNTSATTQPLWVYFDCGVFWYLWWNEDAQEYENGGCQQDGEYFIANVAAGATVTVSMPIRLFWDGNSGQVVLKASASSSMSPADVAVANVNWNPYVNPHVFTASLIPTTFTPYLSPHGTTPTADQPINMTSYAYSYVYNNGNAPTNSYTFSAVCSSNLTNCSVQTFLGSSGGPGYLGLAYIYFKGTTGGPGWAKLIMTAPPARDGTIAKDSVTFTFNVTDVYPPDIWMQPATDPDENGNPTAYYTASHNLPITVYAQDQDGTIATPTVTVNGVPVSLGSVTTTNASNPMAKNATFTVPLSPGNNTVVATVTDGYHTVSTTQLVVYNDATDNAASVTAPDPTPQVGVNTTGSSSFVVSNPGFKTNTYQIGMGCTLMFPNGTQAYPATCSGSAGVSSVTLAPGASTTVPVTFTTGIAVGYKTSVSLTATYNGPAGSSSRNANLMANAAPITPPTISVTPANGTTVNSSTINLVVNWCDTDDNLATHTLVWQGSTLPDAFVPATRAGCYSAGTSTYNGLAIGAWNQQLVATATDAAGHTTQTTTTITNAPPISSFQPWVSVSGTAYRTFGRGMSGSQAFTVRNGGSYTATYVLTASCGTMPSCSPSPSTITLAPGVTGNASVNFVAQNTIGTSNNVTLTATYTAPNNQSVANQQSASISTPPGEPVVNPKNPAMIYVNPGTNTTFNFGVDQNPISAYGHYWVDASCAAPWYCEIATDIQFDVESYYSGGANVSIQAPSTLGSATTAAIPMTYRSWVQTDGGAAATDIGTLMVMLGYHKPTFTPHSGTFTVPSNTSHTESFSLKNNGNMPATYTLIPSCGTFTGGGCVANVPTMTLNPGASGTATVTYTAPAAHGQTSTIRLIATYHNNGTTLDEADTASIVTTTADQVAPTITITPGKLADSVYNTSTYVLPVTVSVCDADGSVTTPTITWNGASITPSSVTSVSRSGCATAKDAVLSLNVAPGSNRIDVSVGDGLHTTLAHGFYWYDETELRPVVTAQVAAEQIIASRAWADTFTVRNPGPISAAYTFAPTCGASAVGCAASPTSATIGAGQTIKVAVGYSTSSSTAMGNVTLTAQHLTVNGTALTHSASTSLSVDAQAPTIAITPSNGTTIGALPNIVVQWCDADGPIAARHVRVDGVLIADNFAAQSQGGCLTAGSSTWNNYLVTRGSHTITADATDGVGHTTTVSSTFTLDLLPIANYTPLVTPKANALMSNDINVLRTQQFQVKNNGTQAATYSFSPICSSGAGCMVLRGPLTIAAGATDTLSVAYMVPDQPDASAQIKLAAIYTALDAATIADTGSVTITTPSAVTMWGVSARPVEPTVVHPPNTMRTYSFWVVNHGTRTGSYRAGFHNGTMSPLSTQQFFTLAPGDSTIVTSTVTSPSSPTNITAISMNITALWPDGITHLPYLAFVATNVSASQYVYAIDLGAPTDTVRMVLPFLSATLGNVFELRNVGNTSTTYSYTTTCTGFLGTCHTDTGALSGQVTIAAGASQQIIVSTDLPAPAQQHDADSAHVRMMVVGVGPAASAFATRDVVMWLGNPPAIQPGVRVSPKDGEDAGPPNTDKVVRFDVINTGRSQNGFVWQATCTPSTACTGTLSGMTQGLSANGGVATVPITFHTLTTAGAAGSVRFTASTTDGAVHDEGVFTVTSAANSSIHLRVHGLNPGGNISRGQCLTIAAGSDAAYECGELRLVHPLSTTTVLNKARTPTLIYNSEHANPRALIAADVTVDPAISPSTIRATVTMTKSGAQIIKSWPWDATWHASETHRVAINVDALSNSIPTGAYEYSLEIAALDGSNGPISTDVRRDTLVIVDRHLSPFGRGWWLDGVEEISTVTPDTSQRLWIGGDGSTRIYTKVPGTSNPTKWAVLPALDGPDTLISYNGGYHRKLRNNAYVEFDGFGRHTLTVNRQNHHTYFGYANGQQLSAGGRLSTITLPTKSAPSPVYTFNYDGTLPNPLQSVTAPGGRVTSITLVPSGGTSVVQQITDPDQHFVQFSWNSNTGALITRTDRRGHPTTYDYDDMLKLRQVSIDMSSNSLPAIVARFCASESRGSATCPISSGTHAYTLYDGPRTDVPDTTKFFVNRFGAPDSIDNALGQRTRIERDGGFPLLAKAVTQPNGFRTTMEYDAARALPLRSVSINPLNTGEDTRVEYTWDQTLDDVVKVKTTLGVVDTMEYDHATGNRLWQQRGNDDRRRISFNYDPDTRLVTGVVSPSPVTAGQTVTTTYDYDALGNLWHTTSPLGFTTTVARDGIGRPQHVVSPVAGSAWFRYQSFTYDPLDRVLTSTDSSWRSSTDHTNEILTVTNEYDPEGNLTLVHRLISPDPLSLGELQIGTEYDAANRKTREFDPLLNNQTKQHWVYDAAGNATLTERGALNTINNVVATYDTLNRVSRRVVNGVGNQYTPAAAQDVQTFTYDVNGNLKTAFNNNSQVTRTYNPNGSIKSETQKLASADLASFPHVYTMQYDYDLDGRRKTLTPQTSMGLIGPIVYAYNPITGTLQSITDGEQGGTFTYVYNFAGLLSDFVEADGTLEHRTYDANGRETARTETNNVVGTLHTETRTYDSRDKMTSQFMLGVTTSKTETYSYNGLGAVLQVNGFNGSSTEQTPRDALGNPLYRSRIGDSWNENYNYQPHTTRLRQISHTMNDDVTVDTTTQIFDATGDLVTILEEIRGPQFCQNANTGRMDQQCPIGTGIPFRLVATATSHNGYDADGHLLLATKETSNDLSGTWPDVSIRDPNGFSVWPAFERGVTEEYRYDALNRRVWLRTHRDQYCPTQRDRDSTSICVSAVQRFVYDGDQILYEIRQPGGDSETAATLESDQPLGFSTRTDHFGIVAYVHGPEIDHPLKLVRNFDGGPRQAILHYQWQGVADNATDLSGHQITCNFPGVLASPCSAIDWVGSRIKFSRDFSHAFEGPVSWWGSLLGARENATGMQDMRNRVYDPRTGRFTQEDPIGLAGGMNLYGFGGGDPINYADPLGLDPCKSSSAWTECLAQAVADWGAAHGGSLGAAAVNAGAALNAGLEATGINAAASAGNDIGSGHVGRGLFGAALTVGGGQIGRGLRGASAGLRALFSESGGLTDQSIIGIRAALRESGFTMGLAENKSGYLFTNGTGEEVRIMRGDNGWYLRVKNAAGNYLDAMGNPGGRATTHMTIVNK